MATQAKPAKRAGVGAAVQRQQQPVPKGRRFDVDRRTGIRRPDPIWHPIPVTEIFLVGGIGLFIVGFVMHARNGGQIFITGGVLLSLVAVWELCWREHRSGFRSHTLLLAFLPVVALHTLIYFAISKGFIGPLALVIDLVVFGVLAAVIHDRYREGQERALRG